MLAASLYALGGPDQGITFDLAQDSVVIGRSRSCDIILMDETTSRKHFKLERHGTTFLLKNLSSQGTKVNDSRIDEILVEDGDRIFIGQTQLRVQLREPEVLPDHKSTAEKEIEMIDKNIAGETAAEPQDITENSLESPEPEPIQAPPILEGVEEVPDESTVGVSAGAKALIQPLRRRLQLVSRGWAMSCEFREGSSPQANFSEFVSMPGNKLALLAIDISGPELDRDLGALVTRSVIKAVLQSVESPAQALSISNRLLRDDLPQGMYVEACVAIFDSASKEIILARAGYPPAFRWQKSETRLTELAPAGIAMNIGSPDLFDDSVEEETFQMQSGDLFFVSSDGVSLASNEEGEEFGAESLQAVLEGGAASVQELIQNVLKGHASFLNGVPPEDDTILVSVGLDK